MLVGRAALAAALLVAVLAARGAGADFAYRDFNRTTGLEFVGKAATSSCEDPYVDGSSDHPGYGYNAQHGSADYSRNNSTQKRFSEASGRVEVRTTVTDADHGESIVRLGGEDSTSRDIYRHTAVHGHRDAYSESPKGRCPLRARLTPSEQGAVGALWHRDPVRPLGGFETGFWFQISDQSRSCTQVKDVHFAQQYHTSCRVHGGDGFAFVIHGHANGTTTVGRGGEELGYAGIENSLAVEFDTWYNPWLGDMFEDHVSIQTRGPDAANGAGHSARVAGMVNASLAARQRFAEHFFHRVGL